MKINLQIEGRGLITGVFLVFLSACAQMPSFDQPAAGEAAAVFEGRREVSLYSFDAQDCMTGFVYTKDKQVRLRPGKEIFVSYYEKAGSDYYCSTFMSFVPEDGAVYKLKSSIVLPTDSGLLGLPNMARAKCSSSFVRTDIAGKEEPVPFALRNAGMLSTVCKKSVK